MTGPRLWDISQTLRPGLPVWPGDTPFALSRRWSMAGGSPVNVGGFATTVHAGAHADAPLHYLAGAASAAEVDLGPYIGPCRLIDARGAGPLITRAFVEAALAEPAERVLFRTFETFPHDAWPAAFTAVDPAAIAWLAEQGARLIGVDAPSLDPENSKTMDAHLAVADADMRVLEGLVLDAPPPGLYELVALPLKLAGLDASPVRAILRELAP
jgi:arylformamidase